MAAILCHMTSKILVQSKDNEINTDIKFCPSILQCSGDITLSNNFNLINPTFKKSVLNCTENSYIIFLKKGDGLVCVMYMCVCTYGGGGGGVGGQGAGGFCVPTILHPIFSLPWQRWQ